MYYITSTMMVKINSEHLLNPEMSLFRSELLLFIFGNFCIILLRTLNQKGVSL